ncbi:MAG TPA: glycosyl transferase, partial [Clostridia bacterium]
CGNPRFCTQYNNSETGENIGPMLSGTSTWLILTFMAAFGVEYTKDGLLLDPVLKCDEENLKYSVNTGKAIYNISIKKPVGFYRVNGGNVKITLDGKAVGSNLLPTFEDGREHVVEMILG